MTEKKVSVKRIYIFCQPTKQVTKMKETNDLSPQRRSTDDDTNANLVNVSSPNEPCDKSNLKVDDFGCSYKYYKSSTFRLLGSLESYKFGGSNILNFLVSLELMFAELSLSLSTWTEDEDELSFLKDQLNTLKMQLSYLSKIIDEKKRFLIDNEISGLNLKESDLLSIKNLFCSLMTFAKESFSTLDNNCSKDKNEELRFLKDLIINFKKQLCNWAKIIGEQRGSLVEETTDLSPQRMSTYSIEDNIMHSNSISFQHDKVDTNATFDISGLNLETKNSVSGKAVVLKDNLIKLVFIALLGLFLALYMRQ